MNHIHRLHGQHDHQMPFDLFLTADGPQLKLGCSLGHQFHHVIDVAPPILEAAGIPEPASVNGITQKPIEGMSMADQIRLFQGAEFIIGRA